jgi:hypothetical protein
MQLSELQTDTLFLANTVTAQYSATDIKRNLNVHYDIAVLNIWNAVSDWEFDEGIDYLPIATTNLVANQDNYELPTDAREIDRVEVKDQAGNYVRLTPIDHSAEDNILTTQTGLPQFYDVVGRSVMLYPVPDYAATDGLLIKMSKSVTQLVNTTDEPKIEREFHRLLSLGAAMDWCMAKGNPTKKRELEREIMKLKTKMKAFYSQRNKDYTAKIKPATHDYSS